MKRNLVHTLGGFDPSYRITGDYHLLLRASLVAKPLVFGFPIANFQQGGASTQNWRMAAKEFHRARVEVFRPRGWARIQEWSDTAVGFMKVLLVHGGAWARRG